jgi:hypothetical protein
MEGVIKMLSAAEVTRPGSGSSEVKLVKRVSSKKTELKFTEQLLESNMC